MLRQSRAVDPSCLNKDEEVLQVENSALPSVWPWEWSSNVPTTQVLQVCTSLLWTSKATELSACCWCWWIFVATVKWRKKNQNWGKQLCQQWSYGTQKNTKKRWRRAYLWRKCCCSSEPQEWNERIIPYRASITRWAYLWPHISSNTSNIAKDNKHVNVETNQGSWCRV